MFVVRFLVLSLPLALLACSPRPAMPPGFSFLDPGVRAGQEQACAEALALLRNVPASSVRADRTSADAYNRGIVTVRGGGISGYCRVTADFRVVEVVF